jgi:TolB protein
MKVNLRRVVRLAVLVFFTVAVLLGSSNQRPPGGTAIAAASAAAVSPRLMSNGVIAFVAGSSNASLDAINPAGSRLRVLAYCKTTGCRIWSYVWSHDGRHIAFLRGRGEDIRDRNQSVYIVNADGTGEKRLIGCGQPSGCLGGALSWAPDDTRLVIARASSLFVLNLKTGGLRRLTHCVSTCVDGGPVWSPDGSKITFSRSFTKCLAACPSSPYVVNADGSGLRDLAPVTAPGLQATWSAEGRTIAFDTLRGIYTVDPNGSHLRLLVPAPPASTNQTQYIASWAPSGARLLYVREPASYPRQFNAAKLRTSATELWEVNLNGARRRRLFHLGCCGGTLGHSVIWSPDGKFIAFSSTLYSDFHWTLNTSKSGLFIMDASGTHVRRLLAGSYSPAWQPLP